ncbi:MAG: hypothetical protein ACRDSJ_10215, partial [Rubrobacteraceae bacterium]
VRESGKTDCDLGSESTGLPMTPGSNGSPSDEREVVEICLDLLFVGEKQAVRAETRGGLGMPSDEARILAYIRENLEGIREETITDFVEKNRERHPVEPNFDPKSRLIPVSDEEFRHIFRDGEGWSRFRETFPDSDGTLRISRVGFDGGVSQALVYAGQQFDWDAGSSGFWLFTKDGGSWAESGRAGSGVS